MSGSVAEWAVAQVIANKEEIAILNLHHQGFETFCPRLEAVRRRGHKTVQTVAPVFPGYLFVGLRSDQHGFRVVDGTHGVRRLVKFGDAPARVPRELILQLKAMCDSHELIQFCDPVDLGDRVQVVSGHFSRWIGKVVDLPDSERVTLLFDVASREVPVTVSRGRVVQAA